MTAVKGYNCADCGKAVAGGGGYYRWDKPANRYKALCGPCYWRD